MSISDEPLRKRPRRACSTQPAPPPLPSDLVPPNALAAFSLSPSLPHGAILRCVAGATAPARDIAWALRGVKAALRDAYIGTDLPWSTGAKRRELRSASQRLLFADTPAITDGASAEPVAMVSFRVDHYDGGASGDVAAYIYEVYVEPRARRSGLAVSLLRVVDDICRHAGVPRAVLTVFNSNAPALKLYKERLGWVTDASCPSLHDNESAGYQILTKPISVTSRRR